MMGRHRKPWTPCDVPYRHVGPAVLTERGPCCQACGMKIRPVLITRLFDPMWPRA